MVQTILAGRASSNALAAAHRCSLRLVDVGVAGPNDSPPSETFRPARIAAGTADLSIEPAMTTAQFDAAWRVGAEEAQRCIEAGNAVLIAGEMGIGNTTSAACLTVLLAGASAEAATGRGAGADDVVLGTKAAIVAAAAGRAAFLLAQDARAAIASVAGLEIVAMAGFFVVGAKAGATLLLDGYVATAAALIAETLEPGVARSMIAAHLSAEPGHGLALQRLGLTPLLNWSMRLGEGTGALVALPLLDSAAALLRDVASLAELGVARED
jgi:nicotinate-nucleotide--dimethylbenzimidazole phosphoribosyltransferase